MSSDVAVGRFAEARATGKAGIRTSKAEEQAAELLDSLKIKYSRSVPHGRWVLDFVLKDSKTVIEVHGVYWHDLPENSQRDKRKKALLEDKGYTVLFWRTDQMHFWYKDVLSLSLKD